MVGVVKAQHLSVQQTETGKYGFVDSSGNYIIQPQYDKVHFGFTETLACVVDKEGYWLIDNMGSKKSGPFSWVSYFDTKGLLLVNKGGIVDEYGIVNGGKYGYIDKNGNEVIQLKYSSISNFNSCGVALVNVGGKIDNQGNIVGGKYGYIHISGKILIEPKYSFVAPMSENSFYWVNVGGSLDDSDYPVGGKFGYVSKNGKEIITPAYSFISRFDDQGFCWVNKGGKIPEETNEDKQQKKDKNKFFKDKSLPKTDLFGNKVDGGKYGFVDTLGNIVVPVKHNYISNNFQEGLVCVAIGNKYGFFNKKGENVVPYLYEDATDFYRGVAGVKLKGLYGYIDKTGRNITEIKYAEIAAFIEGIAFVKTPYVYDRKNPLKNERELYGFINLKGEEITEMKYHRVGDTHSGITACRIGNKLLYIDSLGKELTPPAFLRAQKFNNGIARVMLDSCSANINTKGSKIILSNNSDDNKKKGKFGIINSQGIAITDFIYTDIADASEGVMAVKTKKYASWIDTQGNEFPLRYDETGSFNNGVARFKIYEKWGCVSKDGKIVLPCNYDLVTEKPILGDIYGVKVGDNWGALSLEDGDIVPLKLSSLENLIEFCESRQDLISKKNVSEKDVRVYNVYKKTQKVNLSIKGKIAEEYWDY